MQVRFWGCSFMHSLHSPISNNQGQVSSLMCFFFFPNLLLIWWLAFPRCWASFKWTSNLKPLCVSWPFLKVYMISIHGHMQSLWIGAVLLLSIEGPSWHLSVQHTTLLYLCVGHHFLDITSMHLPLLPPFDTSCKGAHF